MGQSNNPALQMNRQPQGSVGPGDSANMAELMQNMQSMLQLLAAQNQMIVNQHMLRSSPVTMSSPFPSLTSNLPPLTLSSLNQQQWPASVSTLSSNTWTDHQQDLMVNLSSSQAASTREETATVPVASSLSPFSPDLMMSASPRSVHVLPPLNFSLAGSSRARHSSLPSSVHPSPSHETVSLVQELSAEPQHCDVPSLDATSSASPSRRFLQSNRRCHPPTETSEENESNTGDSSPQPATCSTVSSKKGLMYCSPLKEKARKSSATQLKKARSSSAPEKSLAGTKVKTATTADTMSLQRQLQENASPRYRGEIPLPKHLSSIRSPRRILDPRHFVRFIAKHAKDILTDTSFTMKKLVDLACSYFIDVSFVYKYDAADGSLTTPNALTHSDSNAAKKAVCFLVPRYGNNIIRQVNRNTLSPRVSVPLNTSTRAGLTFLQLRHRFYAAMQHAPNATPDFFYCVLSNLVAQFLPSYLVLERVSGQKPKVVYHARMVEDFSLNPYKPASDILGIRILRWSTDPQDYSSFSAWTEIEHKDYGQDPFRWQYRADPNTEGKIWSLFEIESHFVNCVKGPTTPADHLGTV